jgi:DNA-binding XRE family transcriptional regulator
VAGRWHDIAEPGADELLSPAGCAPVRGGTPSAVRGHRLAHIRRSRGLTQHHLAEKMGVSQSHVYEIERGAITEGEALADYAIALGGRLRQTIHFDDGDIAVVE